MALLKVLSILALETEKMGNSATKEQRPQRSGQPDQQYSPHAPDQSPQAQFSFVETPSQGNGEGPSEGRRARPDFFAAMGIGNDGERLPQGTEWRKETKQEREARKLEKERVIRAKERERSMREEHVDGGYLVTQGTYTGTEDFNKGIVRQFMIERRIAPFWRGLNDHDDSWTEHQLVAAARGLPIPAPDEIPANEDVDAQGLESAPDHDPQAIAAVNSTSSSGLSSTPGHRQQVTASSAHLTPPSQAILPPPPNSGSSLGSALAKGRSKTFATLTSSSKGANAELRPREIRLPRDPYINGQRLEAHLYKDVEECPICFIYYPPFLNKTRCCDQGMCSECFVQIKRPDPHPPEHQDPTAPPPPPEEAEARAQDFVSEPATCPFCKVPQFGITYDPPSFKRGLAYASQPSSHTIHQNASGMASDTSLASSEDQSRIGSLAERGRRRTISMSASAPNVVTTDKIRPDWAEKLAAARAHAARRSAAATALHTAAYLMGNRGQEDIRAFPGFGRRGILRRTSGGDPSMHGPPSSAQLFAMMSERNALAANHAGHNESEGSSSHGPPRRGRVEDLEELMLMEAIRLSLASEEERQKREDKDAKKEAKKKEKEAKKAEKEAHKAAKRNGPYGGSANSSTSALQDSFTGSKTNRNFATNYDQEAGPVSSSLPSPSSHPQFHLERARAQIHGENAFSPYTGTQNSTPIRPSHLRTQSNVSSSASSIDGASPPASLLQDPREPGSSLDVSPAGSRVNIPGVSHSQDSFMSGTPPGSGAVAEPMLNFRSLAAMVGDDDDTDKQPQAEDRHNGGVRGHGDQMQGTSTGQGSGKTPQQQETAVRHDGISS